jgi:putative transposase
MAIWARNERLDGLIHHSDAGTQGEFVRWSQHLDCGGGYGAATRLDGGVDRQAGDAFAGASSGLAA